MLTLELSREEAADLASALRSYLNEFHDEIVNTDDFDYRKALQHKRDNLEAVLSRLTGEAHGAAPSGDVGRVVVDGDQTLVRDVPPAPGGGTTP